MNINHDIRRHLYRRNMFGKVLKELEQEGEQEKKTARKRFFMWGWIGLSVGLLMLIGSIFALVLIAPWAVKLTVAIIMFVIGLGVFMTGTHALGASFCIKHLIK